MMDVLVSIILVILPGILLYGFIKGIAGFAVGMSFGVVAGIFAGLINPWFLTVVILFLVAILFDMGDSR